MTQRGSTSAPSLDGTERSRSVARVDLEASTVVERALPDPGVVENTYAEGATVYKQTVSEAFEEPGYERDQIGRPLDERLMMPGEIASIVSGVDYQLAGSVTRDGETLARYTAEGPGAITDSTAFSGQEETITGFSSTLLVNLDTGVVQRLHVERTTDYGTSTDGLATVESTLVFEDVGSTSVERPAWVETAIAQTG